MAIKSKFKKLYLVKNANYMDTWIIGGSFYLNKLNKFIEHIIRMEGDYYGELPPFDLSYEISDK